jgi:hypothetical protein
METILALTASLANCHPHEPAESALLFPPQIERVLHRPIGETE